jgi:GR25 family glycosyltransferase involved in LPS biosynthesis
MIIEQIDKIFCINLESRTDRKQRCEQIFKQFNLNVDFFPAIDGKTIDNIKSKIKPGHVGCCLSHRELYKKIKNSNWKTVLVLEDDVEFDPNFVNLFEQYYKEVPNDWNLLYFGGNHNNISKKMISQHVHKLIKTYTTHCYLINTKCVNILLNEFDESRIYDQEVDVHLSNVQKQIPCYGFYPHLAWQRESFSDIELKNTNYEFLKQ